MTNVIRVGDRTSYGGRAVNSSVGLFIVSGKSVDVIGDKCMRPLHGHQNCTVASAISTHTINCKAVACDGDKILCGATLLSTIGIFSNS